VSHSEIEARNEEAIEDVVLQCLTEPEVEKGEEDEVSLKNLDHRYVRMENPIYDLDLPLQY
jgi:hypothetical protein